MSELSPLHFTGPPEFYADATKVSTSPYGFRLEFGLMTDSPGDAKGQAVVRMSPQHALILYQIMKNTLRSYIEVSGPISLPDEIFTELEIEKEV
jgi:hypothetical protein